MTHRMLRPLYRLLLVSALLLSALGLNAQTGSQDKPDYPLGVGDSIRVQVFQNPDLGLDTRVSESGTITYPLIGEVAIGGLSIAQAEKKIANALQTGGFIQQPQVNIVVTQIRGNQVAVLGQVNRPGRFPLDTSNTRVSDMLANAGGATSNGDDWVIVTGVRAGKPYRKRIDLPSIYLDEKPQEDMVLQGGDTVYVHRAPMFYIYGEVQRPGSYRIERDMTVIQALAQSGGLTARGNQNRLRLHRNIPGGTVQIIEPELTDIVRPSDVIFVKESLF